MISFVQPSFHFVAVQSTIILPLCVRKIVAPPQTFPGNIKVLAIEDYTERVFELNLLPGKPVKLIKRKLMAVILRILWSWEFWKRINFLFYWFWKCFFVVVVIETSIYFTELKDAENRTICEFLASKLEKKGMEKILLLTHNTLKQDTVHLGRSNWHVLLRPFMLSIC